MDREEQLDIDQIIDALAEAPIRLGPVKRLEEKLNEGWEQVVDHFERRAGEVDDPTLAMRLYYEAARLALAFDEAPERAGELLDAAAETEGGADLVPDMNMLRTALAGDQEALLQLFTNSLENSDSNRERARLYLRMGFILERFFDDYQEADNSYQYALELESGYLPAMWARERVARRAGAWEQLGELLATEIELVDDPGRQLEIALDLGELYRDRIGNDEAAVQCYEFAREIDPEHADAREALVELGVLEPPESAEAEADESAEPVEDEPEAQEIEDADVETVEEAPGESRPPAAPPGETEEEAPDDGGSPGTPPEESEAETVEEEPAESRPPTAPPEATDSPPDMPGEGEEASEAESTDQEAEAADVESHPAEPVDEAGSSGAELEEEGEVGGEPVETPAGPPGEDEPDVDAEASPEEGEVEEPPEEPAVEPEEDDDEEEAEETLETEEGDVSEVEAVEEPVETDEEPEPEAEESGEEDVGEEEEEKEEDADEGDEDDVGEEGEVEDDVEETEESEVEEEKAPAAAGDWRERFDDYRMRALEADSSDEAVDWLVDAAQLEWLNDGNEGSTPDIWRDAVEASVEETFYERAHYLFFGGDYWDDVVEILEESDVDQTLFGRAVLVDQGDRDRAESIAEESGSEELEQLLEDLEDADESWRRFQRSLDDRYDDLSEEEQARTTYLRLADLARALDDVDNEVDALRRLDRKIDDEEASRRLMVCYREAGKWPMYVDLVKEQAETIDEERTEDRVNWLEEAVRVYRDEMEHDMMVVNTYKEILEIQPDNLGAVDNLISLYDEMGRSSELIEALQQKAELVEEDDEKIELYTRVADLFLDKFRNQAEAIDAYESVLEIDPHHEEALEFLTEMYEKRRDWEKLVEARRRVVEALEDDEEKVERLKDVAELASDKLRNPDTATDLWLQVRDLDPSDLDALNALEELHEKARNHAELADVVEAKIEQLDDEDELMDLHQKLGMLYSDRLEDPDSAMEAWRRALDLDPESRKARKSLEGLYVDNQRWEELEELYLERDEDRELVRMLESQVDSVEDDDVEIEILLRTARLWEDELGERDRAKEKLELCLDIDPRHRGAAEALEPIYRDEENWEGLRNSLEIVYEHQEEPDARQEYQLQLAELHEEKLEQPGEAFEWYERAFREEPDTGEVADLLEEAAGAADRWEAVVDAYRDVIAETEEADRERTYRLRLGRVLFDELERGDSALEEFETVLDEDEENVEAMAQMEKIYRADERWDELMDVYRRRLDLTDETSSKIEILRGIAEIAELQKGDLPEAIERLEEALELGPENEKTLAELRRLHRMEENWEELVDVVDRQIEIIEGRARERASEADPVASVDPVELMEGTGDAGVDPEASEPATERDTVYVEEEVERLVDLRSEYGAVLDEHLGHEDEALEQIERVLWWRPSHEEAREVGENYLDSSDRELRAARILEPVYEVHGDWESLVETLEIQIEHAGDDSRVDLLEQLGETHTEEIGDAERAFDAYARLLEEAPGHDRAREQIARVAADADMWERSAEVFEDVVETLEDDDLRTSYLFELGSMYRDRLGEPNRAETFYHEILEDRPDSERAMDELQVLYGQTERWRDLLDILTRKLGEADEEEAVDLRFRMAVLWDRMLEEPHEAISVLREILDDHPENLRAVRALNELLEENERWQELAENVELELDLVGEDRKNDVKKRLAGIYRGELDDPNRAVDLYEEVLDDDAADPDALGAMEELMDQSDAPRGRVSRILEPLYEQRNQWSRLVDALEVQVEESEAPDERVELLHRVGRLQSDEQSDPDAAFDAYARALGDDVDNQATLDALYQFAEQLGDWERLIDVFVAEADAQEDPDLERTLLRRAARVYLERLEQPREATPLLHDVLDLFPSDLETVEELEEIYRSLEDWESLVDILQHRAEHVEELETTKDLLYQAGNILDEFLERPEGAVDIYRDVLDYDEEDARAIDRLEELYTRLEWWEDLLGVYERKLDLVDNDEERKDLLYVIAPLYEEQLDRPYDAIETYRDVLEIDEEELGALESLADLYEQTDQWHELLEVLEQQRDVVTLPEEEVDLRYEIGRLWETELGDVLQAVQVYADILEDAPEHEATREALSGMIERGEAEVEAAEVLEPVYEDSGEWQSLVGVKEELIAATHDPDEMLRLYREAGEIYEDRLEDPRAAFDTYLEAVDEAPTRGRLLDTLERLAGELEAWDELIGRFDDILEEAGFEARFELNRRIGRILDDELGEPRRAIERYEEALEAEPENPEVNEALDRLYQDEEEWENLTDILQTRIRIAEDPEQELELRSRLGLLYQNALEAPDQAIDEFQVILEDDPENEFAVESLEEMFKMGQKPNRISAILEPWYLDRDRHDKLVDLYQQRLERLDDPHERFDLWNQIGELYLEKLQQPEEAMRSYGAALSERPDAPQVADRVEELAAETGRWQEAASYFSEALEREDIVDEAAIELWQRLAVMLDEQLGQLDDAVTCYQQVLELEPSHQDALEALDRIYEEQGRWEELAEILQQRLEHTYDEEVLVDVNFRLGQLYQHQLDQPQRAVETYRDLLDRRPAHDAALDELEALHRAGENWGDLFDVLDRKADATNDPDEKVECYSQMAAIAEEMLDRPFDAIDLWNDVLDHDPNHRGALQELGRLYDAHEHWEELVDVLERELDLVDDPAERAELFRSMGTVWSERLGNDPRAIDAWEEVLEIEPTDLEALRALRELYERQGDYERLAAMLERLIEHEDVPEGEELELWEELAEIRADTLMDPDGAIEAWEEVLELDPDHPAVLFELEELYLQEARWEEAAHVLEAQAEYTDDELQKIDLLNRIAELWEQRLQEPDEAIGYYERILEIDPTNMEASRSLEEIYRAQGTSEEELVKLYLDRAEVLDDPFDRLDAFRSAARICEDDLGQEAYALAVLCSAVTVETFDDRELRSEIERLAEETGQWGEAVEAYEGVANELGDTLDAAEIRERIGRWYAEKLDRPDDAIIHLRRALDIDPERDEILELLADIYRELEAWGELARVLQDRIERTADPDQEIELWRNLGELYELEMDDVESAVEAYDEILAIDETDLLAIESLERIYEAEERWEDLISVLRQKIQSTYDPDDLVEIRLRIGRTYEEQLEDAEEAIAAYEELLAEEPDNEEALEALERLYLQTEQWIELLEVYEDRLQITHEPEEQIEIWGRIASVHEERLDEPYEAVEAYNEILMIDPDNATAMENLERLYRSLEEWFDLVEVLRDHIAAAEDDDKKIELYRELGRVQQGQLDEPHAAVEAYQNALEVDPNQPGVLFNLAEQHERTGNWQGAVDAYERLLDQLDEPEDRIDVHFTVGELLEQELGNDPDAERHYERALEIDPQHEPVRQALEGLYERNSDWEALIGLYTDSAEATRDLSEKAEFLARAGEVYEVEVGDRRSALDFYEQALEEDPKVLAAAEPLIDLYLEEDEWERAVPLLDMVIERYEQEDLPEEELKGRYVQLGQVYEGLEQVDRAVEEYRNAYAIDRDDIEVQLGLGRLLFEQEDFRSAVDILERLEQEHLQELETDELMDVYFQLGEIYREFDDAGRAIDYFEDAVELEGYHEPTLEALVECHEEQGNWRAVVEYLRRLLETEEEDKVRFARLTRIGEICADQVGDMGQAVEAYQEAMEIKPESVAVLRKLLEIYREMNQWHEAVEILDRLIEQQDDAQREAKFCYTAAVLYRDKIGDYDRAVEYFNKSLDADLEQLEAFEAIDRIYTEQKEWKELERAYRDMLRRIADSDVGGLEEIKFKLWEGLGEIYRSRLGHPQSAEQAFETAVGLDPDNDRIRKILIDLKKSNDDLEGVIEQHQALIEQEPFRVESYKELFSVYLDTNQYDRAWCMAAALTFLEKASEEERRIYEQYRGQNLRKAEKNLTQDDYELLYHDDQDMLVSYIMSVLNQGLRENYADDMSAWGLHPKKDKLDLEQGTLFANVYKYVADTINLAPVPDVYLKKDQALGVRNANVHPPGIVAGADVVQNTDGRELGFRLGKLVGAMRSEHYLASIGWPTEVLKMFFMAAMHVTNPNLGLEQQLGEQGLGYAQQIQEMPSQMQMQLQKYVSQYLESGENPNLSAWLKHVEHTSNRIGLLLCGDLQKAASCVKTDRTNAFSKASVKDKIRELILFNISDEHTELRRRLGLAIG